MTFLIVLVGWVFSLTLHEFMHALVAYRGGDWTVREKGYLTFNPLRYTHPVMSILLPLLFLVMGGIGLPGGAVYIETWRLRSRNWASAVSLAGPLANLFVALVLALVFRVAPVSLEGIWPGLAFLAFLQVSAAALNLLPIPPLDGYGILGPFLPPALREMADRAAPVGMWILLLLMWYVPFFGQLFWGGVAFVTALLGIPLELVGAGYDQFQFWR